VDVKVSDDEFKVSGADVVTRDIYAANGVVHLVDSLLIPPGALQLTPEKYLLALDCTKFVSMLHSANLTDLIQRNDSKVTILAPRDDVLGIFDAPGDLPEPGSPELRELLLYHFIPGRWAPGQLANDMLIETSLHPVGLDGHAQVLEVERKGAKGKWDISFGGVGLLGEPGV